MPEISAASALPAVPAAAPIAGIAASTRTEGTGPVALQPADSAPTGQTFLTQLKAALASLTSVVTPPQPQAAVVAVAQAPIADAQGAPTTADAEAAKPADHQSDLLPELLASLGFTLVPPAFQPTSADETVATTGGVKAADIQAPIAQAPVAQQAAPTQAEAAQALPPAARPASAAPTAAAPLPQTAATTADQSPFAAAGLSPNNVAASAPHAAPHAATLATSSPTSAATTASTAATGSPTTPPANSAIPTGSTANQQAQAPVQHHESAASGQAAAAPVVGSVHSAFQGSTSQDSGAGNSEGKSAQHKATVSDASSVQGASTSDQFTVSAQGTAATAAPVAGAQPPQPAQTSQVVNQIAHQADLYRLPGNRGVRIQLHPDDLGGVQVTLKYAAGGGIELHINAEHASTGALVQAGWTQLRDALATQGISPDRLVMSVTAPNSASQMDFSSSGGQNGYRSDAGAASFGQSGQGGQSQQRQDDDQRVARTGWTGGLNTKSSDDSDSSRAASIAAASRIDYRV